MSQTPLRAVEHGRDLDAPLRYFEKPLEKGVTMAYYEPMSKEDKYEAQKCVEKAQNLLGAHKRVVKVVVHTIVKYQNNRDLGDPDWQFAPTNLFSMVGLGKVSISVLQKAQDICRIESATNLVVQNEPEKHGSFTDEQKEFAHAYFESLEKPKTKRRIKSTDTLYQYVFDENGGMSFYVCTIVNMAPKKDLIGDGSWITHPENNKIAYCRLDGTTVGMRYYVYEEDVDTRFCPNFGKYKTLVLSEQDDELAVNIYIETLENRIRELEDQIASFRVQIEESKEKLAGWTTES
jgi:hypothetical protein